MPSLEQYRKRQVYAGLIGISLVAIVLLTPYLFAGLPNALNAAFANSDTKYTELTTWDMDNTNGNTTVISGESFYYWYDDSGDKNRNNLTIDTDGSLNVSQPSTAGNTANATTINPDKGEPYYYLVYAYTAKDAIDDGLVKIQLAVSGLNSTEAHTITLYAGDVVLYTTSIAKNDANPSINTTIMVDEKDLMDAVVDNGVDKAYFVLKITDVKITDESSTSGVSIHGSAAYAYNVAHMVSMQDALTIGGIIFTLVAFLGALYALPQYSLPTFNITGRFGRRR